MKFNKKIITLGLIGLLAVGGIAASTAFVIGDATAGSGTATADTAVKLTFGSNTSTELTISTLTVDSPVTKQIEVTYSKSASAAGYVKVAFALTDSSSNGSIKVEISDVAWGEGTVADDTLQTGTLTKNYFISMAGTPTPTEYYLRISGVANGTATFAGSLVIGLSHSDSNV